MLSAYCRGVALDHAFGAAGWVLVQVVFVVAAFATPLMTVRLISRSICMPLILSISPSRFSPYWLSRSWLAWALHSAARLLHSAVMVALVRRRHSRLGSAHSAGQSE